MNSDCKLLFEAYRKICEAPVYPGSAFDDDPAEIAKKLRKVPAKHKKSVKKGVGEQTADDLLTKYGLSDEEKVQAISIIIGFVDKLEGRHFPGKLNQFRVKIVEQIMSLMGKAKWKALHIARVVEGALLSPHIDALTIDGDKFKVSDDAGDTTVKDVLRAKVPDPEQTGETQGHTEETPIVPDTFKVISHKNYMLSPDKVAGDRINTLDDSVKAAIGAIRGKLAIKFTGKELINVLRATVGLSAAQELGTHMIETGVLEAEEEEHEGDVTDVAGDYSHEDDPRWAAQDLVDRSGGMVQMD